MKQILSTLAVCVGIFFSLLENAGAQWVKVGNDFAGEVQCFASSGINIFAGSDGGGVFVSSDNGISWGAINTGLGNKHVHALITSGSILLAGTSGGIYASSNGGTLWLPLNTGLGGTAIVHSIITSGQSLIAGTSNGVYRGTVLSNWVRVDSGMPTDFYINTFIQSDTNLLAGAFNFGVWRSTDNGSFWDQSNSGLTKSDMHAFAEYKNELYTITDGPAMFVSNDNGHSWGEIGFSFSATTLNSLYADSISIFVGSDAGVFRTQDGGSSWTDVSVGLTNSDVQLLSTNGTYLFAAIGDSSVWRRPVSELSAVHQQIFEPVSAKNYPNPFSEKTTIRFTSSEHGFAEITIVNILGVEVAKVFSGELEAGEHSFIWTAKNMPAGMYQCRINTGNSPCVIPLILKN